MIGLLAIFRPSRSTRLAAMAAISAVAIAFVIYLTGQLATPEMALLYGDPEASEGSQIVARLEEVGAPYRTDPDGAGIFVPEERLAHLRITMAELGLPSGGSVGYELFDMSHGLSAATFSESVARLRALEGKLARTIQSIDGVRKVSVASAFRTTSYSSRMPAGKRARHSS